MGAEPSIFQPHRRRHGTARLIPTPFPPVRRMAPIGCVRGARLRSRPRLLGTTGRPSAALPPAVPPLLRGSIPRGGSLGDGRSRVASRGVSARGAGRSRLRPGRKSRTVSCLPDARRAVRAEPGRPPPHPRAGARCHEPAGVRREPAPAREADIVGLGRGGPGVGGRVSHEPGRSALPLGPGVCRRRRRSRPCYARRRAGPRASSTPPSARSGSIGGCRTTEPSAATPKGVHRPKPRGHGGTDGDAGPTRGRDAWLRAWHLRPDRRRRAPLSCSRCHESMEDSLSARCGRATAIPRPDLPLFEDAMDPTTRLEAPTDAAIETFGVRGFWCVPGGRGLAPMTGRGGRPPNRRARRDAGPAFGRRDRGRTARFGRTDPGAVLPCFWCSQTVPLGRADAIASYGVEDAAAQRVVAGPSVHGPLRRLQPVDPPFDGAGAPRLDEAGQHGAAVALDTARTCPAPSPSPRPTKLPAPAR